MDKKTKALIDSLSEKSIYECGEFLFLDVPCIINLSDNFSDKNEPIAPSIPSIIIFFTKYNFKILFENR